MSARSSGGFNGGGAPMSPPGALSQRTDMQPAMNLPDAAYGEQAAFQEIQGGAPMAGGMMPPPDLMSGTERPQVPVTDGADFGPGADSTALPQTNVMEDDAAKIAKYLPQFERMAMQEETPDSFRQFVKYLRAAR
jgi:hypothetical protein